MNKIVKYLNYISYIFGFLIAILLPLRLKNGLNLFYAQIYSNYYRKFFKKCGRNFFIRNPIYVIGPKYISIGNDFYAGYRLRLEAIDYGEEKKNKPRIIIGNNVSFNFDCHVGCTNIVEIGNNVLFASRVFITDHFHGGIDPFSLLTPPALRHTNSKGPVVIEDNVWIGEGVSIMPNVTIGKNSIIGANSVVTKNVPSNCVAAGIPARVIKNLR